MTQEVMTETTEQTPEQVAAESSAAFEAGFGEVRGDAPPKAEEQKPEPVVEAKVDASKVEAPVEAPADPMKAQLDFIVASIGQLNHRLKSNEGRLGKINSTLDSLAAAKAAAETAVKNDSPNQQALKDRYDKKLAVVKEDFPELVEFVEAAREELRAANPKSEPVDVAAIKADFDRALAERVAELEAKTLNEVAKARAVAAVDLRHEGWEDSIKTPEFEQWFGRQAPDIQALANSPKAADAIRMLDAFKADSDKAKKEQEKKQANAERLARAAAPKGVNAPVPASITDEEAFASGYKSVAG